MKVIILLLFITLPVFAQNFHGYECTDDCSGHETGYEWAEDNDIYDYNDCDGNSDSFIEGCEAFVDHSFGDEYMLEDDSDYYDRY